MWSWGNQGSGVGGILSVTNFSSPVQEALGRTDWASVTCGYNWTFALTTGGLLFGAGYNGNGNLGNNAPLVYPSSFVQIGANNNWQKIGNK
jgi:alpha-tubulin suppressor-like RCC1 family protein